MMKKTGILTDSHSGITQEEAKKLGIYVLPMPFYINDQCHYEGKDISREEFIELSIRKYDTRQKQAIASKIKK